MLVRLIWETVSCEMLTKTSRSPCCRPTAAAVTVASRYGGDTLMPKYRRRQPSSARATSSARVRSPTTTSAPVARSDSARSSSVRTSARTGRPRPRRISTTVRPTPPTRPAAPVTRIGASVDMDATPPALMDGANGLHRHTSRDRERPSIPEPLSQRGRDRRRWTGPRLSSRLGRPGLLGEPGIAGRQDRGGQRRRGDQAADDDGGQGALDLGAGGGGGGHRDEAEPGDQRRHQDRPEAHQGRIAGRLVRLDPLLAEVLDG